MLHAVPFTQKVQIRKSAADAASEGLTEGRRRCLEGPGAKCLLGERRVTEAPTVKTLPCVPLAPSPPSQIP